MWYSPSMSSSSHTWPSEPFIFEASVVKRLGRVSLPSPKPASLLQALQVVDALARLEHVGGRERHTDDGGTAGRICPLHEVCHSHQSSSEDIMIVAIMFITALLSRGL